MYLIGVVLFFILGVFFIAMIHNEKLAEKYKWIENIFYISKDFNAIFYPTIFVAIILWPVTITVIFIVSIGYYLFKIFSKLIDHFVK